MSGVWYMRIRFYDSMYELYFFLAFLIIGGYGAVAVYIIEQKCSCSWIRVLFFLYIIISISFKMYSWNVEGNMDSFVRFYKHRQLLGFGELKNAILKEMISKEISC